jgi:RNA polymerase sigma factor (sigma-70 family)
VEVSSATAGVSEAQLNAAELGFRQLLRRKRFSRQFVDNHGADLMAKAEFEYSRHLARGGEVTNPTGWLINCAWRRTQNLLEEQGRTPRMVGVDVAGPLVDEATRTPEQQVLDADRARRVRDAIGALSVEERQVIELCYFEGMSVREVGRALKWNKSKADRRHRAALQRVREVLGVDDVDALAIDLGLAAYVSLAAEKGSSSVGHGALADSAGRLGELATRAHEVARRFLVSGGGEPSTAAVAGSAGRAAGACGAAALACFATGVVGPGLKGVDVVGNHHAKAPLHRVSEDAVSETTTTSELPPPVVSAPPSPPPSSTANEVDNTKPDASTAPDANQGEFDPFASETTPPPASSSTSSATASSAAPPPSTGGGGSSTARTSQGAEFGF